ncbi:hypothetical protein [Klebsiella pneumoniae]|uniref:hypothetical protein n=1 Tax=Klebsiella pneumoniae TaxID=573 RepID=UPI000BD21C0C|nr:hypothetical protein [Klebsiella pneumoniae]PCM88086.1 hypothetical protein CP908_08500 [Klebsiella pneumoniae]HBT3667380.1 hypothetical protein [Klebsiella pneumoniae]
MTTDITELALRLKLEVHRAVSNFNPQMNIKTRDLKELVEALEKAQRYAEELREWNAGLAQESCEREQRIFELENQLKSAENNEIDARCHIAELESRTVKLPEPFELAGLSGGSSYYYADEVDAALTAQGIKVEAE